MIKYIRTLELDIEKSTTVYIRDQVISFKKICERAKEEKFK